MDKYAIEFKDYGFKYSNNAAFTLDKINFKVKYGELTLISGPSGQGKSTLISSINGIIPNIIKGPTCGDILIDGLSILNKKVSFISKSIGSILQNADSQIIHHKVEDEIAFACENIGIAKEEINFKIKGICEEMDLNPNWNTRTLSGGQKQKLITATTLAMGQKILILDEPLANLDIKSSKRLLKHLKNLCLRDYAILIVEHRTDIVLPYADSNFILEGGNLKSPSLIKDIFYDFSGDFPSKNILSNSKLLFSLKDLNYRVKNKSILKNISLDIYKGERIVILGENGCGKTSLMKIIAKLIDAKEGDYLQFLDEKTKKKPSKYWFEKLGYVYQNPNYQLFMPSVEKEILYGSKSEKLATNYLKIFNLDNIRNSHPQSLSEGQKRKLTIASIMAMEPNVILLDEPTVGQDHSGLKYIIEHLNSFHQKNKCTIITITHDFRCAKALADKIIWMQNGKIHKIGGPELADEYLNIQLSY